MTWPEYNGPWLSDYYNTQTFYSGGFSFSNTLWPKLDIPDHFDQDPEEYLFVKDLIDLPEYRENWIQEFLKLNPDQSKKQAEAYASNKYYYKDARGIIYSGRERPAIVYDSKDNACCTCGCNLFYVQDDNEDDSWINYRCSQCGTEG